MQRPGFCGAIGTFRGSGTTDLGRAHRVERQGGARASDRVTFDYEGRFLRRRRLLTNAGNSRIVDLGEVASLEDGDALVKAFPDLDLVLIASGGDNLAATFGPELADLTLYVIDTAAGQDIPRKKGPGLTRSDLRIVNKTDLAPHVGVDMARLEADTRAARDGRPHVMASLRQGLGVQEIVEFICRDGGL